MVLFSCRHTVTGQRPVLGEAGMPQGTKGRLNYYTMTKSGTGSHKI